MQADQIRELAGLPFDLSKPAPAFRPYKERIGKAKGFILLNALPLASIALAVVL